MFLCASTSKGFTSSRRIHSMRSASCLRLRSSAARTCSTKGVGSGLRSISASGGFSMPSCAISCALARIDSRCARISPSGRSCTCVSAARTALASSPPAPPLPPPAAAAVGGGALIALRAARTAASSNPDIAACRVELAAAVATSTSLHWRTRRAEARRSSCCAVGVGGGAGGGYLLHQWPMVAA